jgi:hypothetical protein
MQSALVSALLLYLRDSSELSQRSFAPGRRRHSGGEVLGNLLIEMELKFAAEFVFHASAPEDGTQSEL